MSEAAVDGTMSVLEAAPPRFSAAEVAGIAERLFGLSGEATAIRPSSSTTARRAA
jgi:hypothetical protein